MFVRIQYLKGFLGDARRFAFFLSAVQPLRRNRDVFEDLSADLFRSNFTTTDKDPGNVHRKGSFFFFLFYLKSFHISDIRLILQLSC